MTHDQSLMEIVQAAADRFDKRPEYRASVHARAELARDYVSTQTKEMANDLRNIALTRLDHVRRQALNHLTKGMTMSNQYDEVMARLNSTKPVIDRDPFIGEGQHDSLIVTAIETYNDQKWGKSVKVSFKAEKSNCHAPGAGVVKIWNLFKPSKFPTQSTDADQFANFVTILQGIPEGSHGASCQALLKPRAEGGNAEAQLARGARIRAFGTAVGQPNATTGKRYVKVQWSNIPQDGNMIGQARAQLDAEQPYTPRTEQAPAQPVYPQAQPASGGFLSMIPTKY